MNKIQKDIDGKQQFLMSEIKLTDQQLNQDLFHAYESKIKSLSDENSKLYNSLCNAMEYDDIAAVLGDILQEEPKEIDEQRIIDMFNVVREKIEEADQEKEKFIKYKNLVDLLVKAIGEKIPKNLKPLVQQLSSEEF